MYSAVRQWLFIFILNELPMIYAKHSDFSSFHKLDFNKCLMPKHLQKSYIFLKPQCSTKRNTQCQGFSVTEKCIRTKNRYNSRCRFEEHFSLSDRIYLECPPKKYIRIKTIIYLTLFGLHLIPLKESPVFVNGKVEASNTKCRMGFRELYVKNKRCFSHNSKAKVINALNKKIMGNEYSLQIKNIKPNVVKNFCYNINGKKVPPEMIDCNSSISLHGNGCHADYVRIHYTCENYPNINKVNWNQSTITSMKNHLDSSSFVTGNISDLYSEINATNGNMPRRKITITDANKLLTTDTNSLRPWSLIIPILAAMLSIATVALVKCSKSKAEIEELPDETAVQEQEIESVYGEIDDAVFVSNIQNFNIS